MVKNGGRKMNKKFWIVIIVLVAVVLIVILATRKSEPDVIIIGVSLPLSGDAAVWGKSQKDGYELALSQINDKGGINRKKLVLVYGDDKGLPKDGVNLLRKLIDVDGIHILTGVANSSVALAYIPIINERNTLLSH